ncbi:MAG: peptide deformylase [Patescibacteria group bacterium]|nr:peptide deformylase [Patescibacteria group bacterium]
MLKIVHASHQILSSPTKPVKKIDQKIKKIISQMVETLEAQKDPIGVGLAANQVNLDLSIFIMKPNKKSKPKVFINPKILKKENLTQKKPKKNKKLKIKLEGCLSIPKIWGSVKRADKVLLEYQNLEGEMKKEWFSGFEATIVQHETDHLNGVLFTQRASEQNQPLYQEKEEKLVPIEI